MQTHSDVVPDPVGHISISGVHGRRELEERLARANGHPALRVDRTTLLTAVGGAILGAALMYFLHPDRR